MSGVAVVKVPRAMTHTPKVSSRGGAELNPEASVFHLPPAAAAAAAAPQAAAAATSPINGFHTNVYPFMNGDVGQQYCGVSPPTSDTTGATMAVDSPVEVYPAEASSAGDPAPAKAALLSPKSPEVMAAAAVACTQQEGNAASCSSPLSTPQQNGEVSPESSQPSASPQPTSPLVTPPPGATQSDAPPQESPAPPQDKAEETGAAVAGKESSAAIVAGKEGAAAVVTGEGAAAAAMVGEGAGGSETQGTQTTPAQTPTPGTPAPPTPLAHTQPQPLTRDQIKQLVAQQVEYFFSRENLSNDPYLISQMDSDQYVPVYILANCSQFKNITKDHSIIVEALKESPFVQLDEENNRVRPNYKRCIVILREIPESTPVDEIESMFKKEECPKVVSCEFVHNSSWYVTFESDEDAQKAYWYLRGVVKTFKDKPILARIKTKPMSRLGCLSVLPSYGNKGGAAGEGKEGCSAPPTPGSAGLSAGPGTPAPTASYNNPGGQRFMYSTPSSVTPNSYSYYTTPTTPMPTAFFYPNVMQWTQPGGFYDINSFLQFNGLSPQAAFKPPTNHNMRYPGSRRWVPSSQYRNSKHRDGGRYDKGDGRHNSGANQGNPHNPHPGHFQRHHLRPQAPQSPSQAVHRLPPNQAPLPSAPAPPVAPTPPPPPPPPPPHTSAGPGGISHDSFAHSDFSIASQSSLYTSFSPPMGQPSSLPGEKEEVATVTTRSSSIPNQASLPPSTSTNSNPATTTSSNNTSLNTSVDTHHSPSTTPAAPHLIQPPTPHGHPGHPPPPPPPHPHQRHQYPLVGPPPPPHRGGYSDNYHHPHHPHHPHHHMARDPQQARQMSRGMRRRPRGREEEGVGGVGPRGGPGQRMPGGAGGPPLPPGTDSSKTNGPHHQDVTQLPPAPPPQFDLEGAAFPPLPGSDEQVPVAEEKRPVEPVVSAWGSDNTQRFSDVMKGTAKPRPTSQSSLGEKETTSDPPTPIDTTPSPALPTVPIVTPSQPPVPTSGPHPASQAPSSTATQPASTPEASSVAPTTTTTAATVTAATITAATVTAASIAATSPATPTMAPPAASSSNSSSSSSSQNNSRVEVRTGPQRPDRRPGMGGPRERRDYHRDYQREGRNGGGRGGDHRTMRDNTRPGKENRPLPPRPSREDRMDADGWITKGPKESRAQRENREQWERAEARDSRYHLVNGDSSPPPSPKPQKTEVKVSSEETCVETTKTTPAPPLNNNDGEHKTSWAKMALASKDEMERLAAELKEKEEQEKMMKQRLSTRPQPKPQEKVVVSRERDGKLVRRDGPPRDNRMVGERGTASFRPRDSARPKSPK